MDSLAWSTVTNIQLCFAIHLYGMVVGRFAGSVRLMFGLFVVSRRSNTATIIASRRGLSMSTATTSHTQTHPDCSFFSASVIAYDDGRVVSSGHGLRSVWFRQIILI